MTINLFLMGLRAVYRMLERKASSLEISKVLEGFSIKMTSAKILLYTEIRDVTA